MKTLKLEVLDSRAMRPMGNPFGVKIVDFDGCQVPLISIVRTGVRIELPDDLMIMVVSVQDNLTILGWNMGSQGLRVIAMRDDGFVEFKEPFAMVHIIEKKSVPIRFIEFTPEGKRMICGGPESVAGEKDG